ncbi:MAG: hypothetical protein L3J92_07465 [Thermoplasmata archaeon]|nr:hypothetical protein [Thermoplasmata archaeon]
MTLDFAEFTAEARSEFLRLPRPLQVQLRAHTAYLLSHPYRSYPWLQVKELRDLPGVWKFRLGTKRVFYIVDGSVLVYVAIVARPPAYTAATRAEVRRLLADRRRKPTLHSL